MARRLSTGSRLRPGAAAFLWLVAAVPALAGPDGAAPAAAAGRAMFAGQPASPAARGVADWIVDSHDNQGMPFVIVDKAQARILVFDRDGHLSGAAAALLGLAHGDDSVPGIGDRKLAAIRPEERTTPAGRFVSALGQDLGDRDVVWVDYEAAISLHRVVTSKLKEQRLHRLATPTPDDNRISYGCINVPTSFYDAVVKPAFTGTDGVVYILPEVRPIAEVFKGYYDVDAGARPQPKSPAQP